MITQETPPNKYFFTGFNKISDGLLYSSKEGTFNKVEQKCTLHFRNPFLRHSFQASDLERKIKKRNDKLKKFKECYQPFLQEKLISVIAMVCYADRIKDIGDFIKFFTKNTLSRFGIESSSYIYVYDIGKKSNRPHWHLFIVTEPFCDSLYDKIFKKSQSDKVKGIPMQDSFNLINYCMDKDLFVGKTNRSHGVSRKLDFPKSTKLILKARNLVNKSELNTYE